MSSNQPKPEKKKAPPAEFVLVIRDGASGGVEVAGLGQPTPSPADSPSHTIGRWLADNFDELAQRAALAHNRANRSEILVDPEKTIITAGG